MIVFIINRRGCDTLKSSWYSKIKPRYNFQLIIDYRDKALHMKKLTPLSEWDLLETVGIIMNHGSHSIDLEIKFSDLFKDNRSASALPAQDCPRASNRYLWRCRWIQTPLWFFNSVVRLRYSSVKSHYVCRSDAIFSSFCGYVFGNPAWFFLSIRLKCK